MQQEAIYIVGAGAIGKALAVFLKLAGKHVVILRGSVDDGSDVIEEIEVELKNNKRIDALIRTTTFKNFSILNGLVILTNKSFGNQQLAETLKHKVVNTPIVFLQNGLNVEQPFIKNGYAHLYRAVLFATSQIITTNKLRFRPVATSPVGIICGNAEGLDVIVSGLSNNFFQFGIEENIQPVIWTKAIVNSVFNSVCPLLEADNGIFCRDERALNIAREMVAECVAVASLKGICLQSENVMNKLLLISKSSEGQLISTLQDINNKRRTEIETLNFAIAGIAKELHVLNLVPKTKLLGELVEIKSRMAGYM